ncbi:MAG: DUF2157 domain-containing protein [Kaiparowitsia implicata GSE-PSE-MK54-09C]|jgi:uncharacterized membrane protein|nr:DUF2157 domain-containing protein [Kaiparowitsia implicata GSE-PSE-MK54-09C]
MQSDKFRQQLRSEAQQWQVDGLISAEQYARLSTDYEFEQLDLQSRDRFVMILIGLGSVLLGLGVITFVAANWQAIPRDLKMVLMLSLFFAVNITGYWLWQRPSSLAGRVSGRQRLGQGLLLLGGLILGATLALGGQLYHRSGSPYELCLVWGFGVLAMAFGLRLVSLGVLAVLLTGIGYWLGVQQLGSVGILAGFVPVMRYMPVIAGVLFILLAYRCRSNLLFVLGSIAAMSALGVSVLDKTGQYAYATVLWQAIALTLPPAVLWSYDDGLWWQIGRRPQPLERPFRPLARGLALTYLASAAYLLSFRLLWVFSRVESLPLLPQLTTLITQDYAALLDVNLLLYCGLLVVGWVRLMRPAHRLGHWGLTQRDATVLLLLVTLGIIVLWHGAISPIPAIATLVMNVLVMLLAIAGIRQGLASGDRLPFWSGMGLLSLTILSRFFEYNTGLLLKSLAFALCGLGVIIIGLWFERNVRQLDPGAAPLTVSAPPSLRPPLQPPSEDTP